MSSVFDHQFRLPNHPILSPPGPYTPSPRALSVCLDDDFYFCFGKYWAIQECRRYIENQGHKWSDALHHRFLSEEHLIRSMIGRGYTEQQISEIHERSSIGYPLTVGFLRAYSRCEIDYFQPEIQYLRNKGFSQPKALDRVKGGTTKNGVFEYNMELAGQRFRRGRLLGADVSDDRLRHRLAAYARVHGLPENAKISDRHWENEDGVITPFSRGFLRDLDESNNHWYSDSKWQRQNAAYVPSEILRKNMFRCDLCTGVI